MPHLIQALVKSTEKTFREWNLKIQTAIQTKEQQRADYEAKKRQLLPQLIQAHERGVSSRELEKITGINRTTISRWIREGKKEKEKQNVKSN